MEALKGIDLILLYRILSKASTEAAWKMDFQTEHENSLTRDSDAVVTKDGTVQSLKPVAYDFSATSLVGKGDPHVDEMRQAMIAGELIEIWEINRVEKGTGENADKYKATYYQAYIGELSMAFAVNGVGQDGYATLTAEQEEVVQYTFKDTVKETLPEG